MFAILGLGFLLGMQHALEADHIAAVSSIAARRTDVGDIVKHGLTWGIGHTLTLFAFAGAAIVLGEAIPEHFAQPLEAAVGLMLVGLGAHVLWRLWRDRCIFIGTITATVRSTFTRIAMPATPRAFACLPSACTWFSLAHAVGRFDARQWPVRRRFSCSRYRRPRARLWD